MSSNFSFSFSTVSKAATVNYWSIPGYVGEYYLSVYAYSACFFIGVPSSLIAALVIFRMPRNPSISILLVMCIADFIMLFVGLPNRVLKYSISWAIRLQSTIGCQLHYGIVHYAEIALYYEALFSIVRATSLWFPLRAQSIFSMRNTWVAIASLAFLQLVKTFFQVYWMGLPSCDYLVVAVGDTFALIDLILVFAMPFGIDVICSILVAIALQRMARNRKKMTVSDAAHEKQNKTSASLTRIMIVTNASVFLTYGPYRLLLLLDQYLNLQGLYAGNKYMLWSLYLVEDVFAFLTYVNHANILFYLLVGKTFRVATAAFLRCRSVK